MEAEETGQPNFADQLLRVFAKIPMTCFSFPGGRWSDSPCHEHGLHLHPSLGHKLSNPDGLKSFRAEGLNHELFKCADLAAAGIKVNASYSARRFPGESALASESGVRRIITCASADLGGEHVAKWLNDLSNWPLLVVIGHDYMPLTAQGFWTAYTIFREQGRELVPVGALADRGEEQVGRRAAVS